MPEIHASRQRRYDPGRRERIIEAALRVVVRDGLDMLTHRAVAAEADVQVGSITYYFTSKKELVLAVLERSVETGISSFADRLEIFGAGSDLVGALTGLMSDLVLNASEGLLVDYEVFIAVRRKPMFRDLAARWPSVEYDAIAIYTDRDTARMLTDLFEGMLVQFIVYGREFQIEEVRRAFERGASSVRSAG